MRLAGIALILALGLSAPAGGHTLSGKPRRVKPVFNFNALACPSSGACVAVGQSQKNSGIIVPVRRGVPGRPAAVRGSFSLGGVACPRANFCIAVGQGLPLTTAVVVPIRRGKPGRPRHVPRTLLYGIGCGSSSSCWATGERANRRRALVVHIDHAKVKRVRALAHIYAGAFYGPSSAPPGSTADSGPPPACSSATSCLAVGATRHGRGSGLIVKLSGGKVRATAKVPDTSLLSGVACPTASKCVAVGYPPGSLFSISKPGRIVDIAKGRPTHVLPARIAGTRAVQLSGISCLTVTSCYAVGQGGAVLTIADGRPTAIDQAPGQSAYFGLSCNPRSCLAAGGVFDSSAPENEVGTVFSFPPPATSDS
jgi:hypothetical protein